MAMDWIIIGLLYVFGIAFFRLLGGVDSAADAIQRWGRASARRRKNQTAPSS